MNRSKCESESLSQSSPLIEIEDSRVCPYTYYTRSIPHNKSSHPATDKSNTVDQHRSREHKTRELVYILLCTIYISSLIIANIISAKSISFFNISIPSSLLITPLTYLIIDIINESYGPKRASDLVKYGLISSINIWLIVLMVKKLPYHPESPVDQLSFEAVFHQGSFLIVSSLIGYFFSQRMNISLYSFFKLRLPSRLWLRYSISSCLSQTVETIFIYSSYIFVSKYLNTGQGLDETIELTHLWVIASHILFRMTYSLSCTPVIYLSTMIRGVPLEPITDKNSIDLDKTLNESE